MESSSGKPLVIGISSRALLDLEQENAVFDRLKAVSLSAAIKGFIEYQRGHQDDLIPKGVAFPLVKALLNLNKTLSDRGPGNAIEVIIISRNHPDCGLRILRSLAAYGLEIPRAAFTGGMPVVPELQMFGVDLFLSYEEQDVIDAGNAGVSAAKIFGGPSEPVSEEDTPLLAFDGDSTLFSNESDLQFDNGGIAAFTKYEFSKAGTPLEKGPMYRFVAALAELQRLTPIDNPPFRIALVTSRNFYLMERPIETLRAWGIRLDKAYAIGRLEKHKVLNDLRALMFFDNDPKHCADAAGCTPTAQVLWSCPTAAVETNGHLQFKSSINARQTAAKSDFLLICRSYLNLKKNATEGTQILEQWFDHRLAGREASELKSFLDEFKSSVSGTPVGNERPAKGEKNAKSIKLIDYLDLLARKHFSA